MKKVVVTMLGILFLTVSVYSQAPITFHLQEVESSMEDPVDTPWSFDADDPGLFTHDGNPFTFSGEIGYDYHNYSYKWFYSIPDVNIETGRGPTMTWCTSENLDYVDGTDGFRVEFQSYTLTGFWKINTVNPGAAWNIAGQAGDKRIYTGGVGLIYHDDGLGGGEKLVLQIDNCVLTAIVHYPTAAQMRELEPLWLWQNWQNPVGTGEATIAEGWGTVNIAMSDPQWVATFADANTGNRVDFELSTMSHVMQGFFGYYDFDFGLVSAPHEIQQGNEIVPLNPIEPVLVDFPALDVSFLFSDAVGGGDNLDLDDLNVFYNIAEPDGDFPVTILSFLPRFWEFSTNLASFTTSITFDLSGMNFGDSNNWKVLRKETLQNSWDEWLDVTILDENRIRANNVSAFSEWTIGSTEDAPLPVTLSSFTAIYSGTNPILQWTTQSESSNQGWNVYRAYSDAFTEAFKLNSVLIEGAGSTSEITEYSYTDELEIQSGETYFYWLESVDYANTTVLHGPIHITIPEQDNPDAPELPTFYGLIQNYPNPFNPSTEIMFRMQEDNHVNISIYNLKGEIVTTLFNDFVAKEILTKVVWNGQNQTGNQVASGIYFCRLNSPERQETKKMLLIK